MSKVETLRTIPGFENLSISTLNSLAENSRPVSFQKYDILLHQGDSGDFILIIYEGVQRVYTIDEDGKEVNINIHSKGVLGELPIINPGRDRAAYVEALEENLGFEISKRYVLQLMETSPDFLKLLTEQLANKLYFGVSVSDLNKLELGQRVYEYLKLIQAHSGKDYLDITQDKLAATANATRPRVNEVLAELEKEGKIARHDKKIYLH